MWKYSNRSLATKCFRIYFQMIRDMNYYNLLITFKFKLWYENFRILFFIIFIMRKYKIYVLLLMIDKKNIVISHS